MTYKTLEKALFDAIKKEDTKKISYIFQLGANVFAVSNNGKTMLDVAIETNNEECISLIKKAMVESFSKKIESSKGASFIKSICEIESKDKKNLTDDLFDAIVWENTEEAIDLIKKGADLSVFSDAYDGTPLIVAVTHGNLEVVKRILAEEVDVNKVDSHGYSALAKACSGRNVNFEIVKLLVENGADVNGGIYSSKPLIEACWNGHFDVVKILVENGADVNIKNSDNLTPLLASVECEKNHYRSLDVAKYLIDQGADINARYEGGNELSVLSLSISNDREDLVDILLGKKVDINDGLAVRNAINSYDTVMLKKLIDAGVEINSLFSQSPLLYVIGTEKAGEKIEMLIDVGVDIDAKDSWGVTAFLMAVKEGDLEVVDKLVEKGCDISAPEGRTWRNYCDPNNVKTVKGIINKYKKGSNQGLFGQFFSRD